MDFLNEEEYMSKIKDITGKMIFSFFSLFPLKNVVVGSSFYGKRYENNPRFVFEKLEEKYPNIKKTWICRNKELCNLPQYVKPICGKIQGIYTLATAKVIIDSHFVPIYFKKRKGQLAIFMYHGGIGIKRNSNEVPARKKTDTPKNNADNMSFFISNSSFMNRVIRGSLEYKGPILKCGYPKDDPLFEEQLGHKEVVCRFYDIPFENHLVLYAPTYRQDINDYSGFCINLQETCKALSERFGGDWIAIVKWHPNQKINITKTKEMYGPNVIDATAYGNMQELIIASDAFISDYSSCIFEAAERKIPCFSFATDWEVFKNEQGFHFEIDSLPFPYCSSNDELVSSILNFDNQKYLFELDEFMKQEGLEESGRASEIIADIINEFISGNTDVINTLEYEGE